MTELRKTITNAFPGANRPAPSIPGVPPKAAPSLPPKAAPSIPPKASAPSLPPKAPSIPAKAPPRIPTAAEREEADKDIVREHLIAQGKDPGLVDQVPTPSNEPEEGFVNPTGFVPKKAAASPEEAAAQQGIEPTAPEAEIQDEVSSLDKDQLKPIAIYLGLVEEKTRPREATLRSTIRAYLKDRGFESVQAAIDAHGTEAVKEEFEPQTNATIENDTPATEEDRAVVSSVGTEGFTLFVDCAPRRLEVLNQGTLVKLANLKIQEKVKDAPDYRYIPYTGSADLGQAALEVIDELRPAGVVIHTGTPEGSALFTRLSAEAAEVVL